MFSLDEFMMKNAGQEHAKGVSRLDIVEHHVSDRPLRSDAPCTSTRVNPHPIILELM